MIYSDNINNCSKEDGDFLYNTYKKIQFKIDTIGLSPFNFSIGKQKKKSASINEDPFQLPSVNQECVNTAG